jgi:hypothetical protein
MTYCRRTWRAPVLEALLPAQLMVRRWIVSIAGEASMARRQYPAYRRRTAWCTGSGHLSPARSHRRARGAPAMGLLGSPAVAVFLVV